MQERGAREKVGAVVRWPGCGQTVGNHDKELDDAPRVPAALVEINPNEYADKDVVTARDAPSEILLRGRCAA